MAVTDPGGRPTSRLHLWMEFVLIFVVGPVLLWAFRRTVGRLVIPILLVLGLACLWALLRDPTFDRRRLWRSAGWTHELLRALLVFVPSATAITFAVWWLRPDWLLSFPRERTHLWALVMFAYPVLSVYPQELIFRTFFFHRYRPIFAADHVLVAMSGVTFGLAHLFFQNWVAPALTTAGGILFAAVYLRTGSTLKAGIHHGLWGDFLFTVGLGSLFYGGRLAVG